MKARAVAKKAEAMKAVDMKLEKMLAVTIAEAIHEVAKGRLFSVQVTRCKRYKGRGWKGWIVFVRDMARP